MTQMWSSDMVLANRLFDSPVHVRIYMTTRLGHLPPSRPCGQDPKASCNQWIWWLTVSQSSSWR